MTTDEVQQDRHAVAYAAMPVGEVPATEAAVDALGHSRRWALAAATLFCIAGGIGVVAGIALLVIGVVMRPTLGDEVTANFVIGPLGLVYGGLFLVAGVLLIAFTRAAGKTHALRREEDFERAMLAMWRFWRWAAILLLLILAFPPGVLFVAALLNVWP